MVSSATMDSPAVRMHSSAVRRTLPFLAGFGTLLAAAVVASATPTRSGEEKAPTRLARGMTLLSQLKLHSAYNDVWGHTTADGREYALVGTTTGVSIVNITDRAAPREVAFFAGPVSAWRDIKVYRDHMYVVNETGGGMQIINIRDPENPRAVAAYRGFETAHNLYVDPLAWSIYVAGSNVGQGGVLALSLHDPQYPRLVGSWDLQYAHDVFVRGSFMYVSAIDAGALYMVLFRDPRQPSTAGVIGGYPSAFTHASWLTKDDRHILIADERPGALVRVWNIEDKAVPALAGTYAPEDSPGSTPHNVFVEGDLAFLSYYTAGVRVLDVSDPTAPEEVAFYDTLPGSESGGFSGCWGVYPFYRNSPGLLVATDIDQGLFVLQLWPSLARLEEGAGAPGSGDGGGRGRVEDASIPGSPATRGGSSGDLRLATPSPNPLPPGASLRTEIVSSGPGPLAADVVDAAGRLVRRLLRRPASADATTVTWDGRDDRGRPVAAGTYFLRVRAGADTGSRRVTVLR